MDKNKHKCDAGSTSSQSAPATAWEAFDKDAFVLLVVGRLVKSHEIFEEFSTLKKADRVAYSYDEALVRSGYEELKQAMSDIGRLHRPSELYFAFVAGNVPRDSVLGPPPAGLLGHICFAVFRRTFHILRKAIMILAYASRADPDSESCGKWAFCSAVRLTATAIVLKDIAVHSAPVRHRLSCDPVLMDIQLKYARHYIGYTLATFPKSNTNAFKTLRENCLQGGVLGMLVTFGLAFLENSGPFTRFIERSVVGGKYYDIVNLWESSRPESHLPILFEDANGVAGAAVLFATQLVQPEFLVTMYEWINEHMPPAAFIKLEEIKRLTKDVESTPDSCDACSRSEGFDKLMRCSKCHVAWYCSRECQSVAWKEHRGACFDASKMSF